MLFWRPALLLTGLVATTGCAIDEDVDGYGPPVDCDDLDPTVHPGAREFWDGKDNDCDGVVDVTQENRWFTEGEPNDTLFEDCFAGAGQYLGTLAATGMASFVDGRIDAVEAENYDLGDRDCLAFHLADDAALHLQIQWPEADTDLDFAVWSVWEEDGSKQPFIGASDTTPLITGGSSDGAMSASETIYLWIVAYDGVPTPYRVSLWTTWANADASDE